MLSCSSQAKQFQMCNAQNCFLLESRICPLHLGTSLCWKRIHSIFRHWRLDALSIPHCGSWKKSVAWKGSAARGHNCTPLFALFPAWEHEFTQRVRSILFVIWTAMTHFRKFRKNQEKTVTGLLLDKFHKPDFTGPLACRASKVLGPISRRVAYILPHMENASRASRPGLLVGFLRLLCNVLCITQRFHTAELDHTCRIRCPDELDSLSLQWLSQVVYHLLFVLEICYDIDTKRSFLHDLINGVLLRSLHHVTVVLGFFDVFVFAHVKHRLDSENSGNFGDCMKEGSVHSCHYSCLCRRVSNYLSCAPIPWRPTPFLEASHV